MEHPVQKGQREALTKAVDAMERSSACLKAYGDETAKREADRLDAAVTLIRRAFSEPLGSSQGG